MALQIWNTTDHLDAFPLSKKDYERAWKAKESYNWTNLIGIFYCSYIGTLPICGDIFIIAELINQHIMISNDILLLHDLDCLTQEICKFFQSVKSVSASKNFSSCIKFNHKFNPDYKIITGSILKDIKFSINNSNRIEYSALGSYHYSYGLGDPKRVYFM